MRLPSPESRHPQNLRRVWSFCNSGTRKHKSAVPLRESFLLSAVTVKTRATIGPVPGELVLLAGFVFHATWVTVAFMTYRSRRGAGRVRPPRAVTDAVLELARGG